MGGGWATACAAAHGVAGIEVNGASAGTGSAAAACVGADRASVRRSSRSSVWAAWARKKPTMPSTQPTITSRPRRKKNSIVTGGSRLACGSRRSRQGKRVKRGPACTRGSRGRCPQRPPVQAGNPPAGSVPGRRMRRLAASVRNPHHIR